jgi:hypothetical protein
MDETSESVDRCIRKKSYRVGFPALLIYTICIFLVVENPGIEALCTHYYSNEIHVGR